MIFTVSFKSSGQFDIGGIAWDAVPHNRIVQTFAKPFRCIKALMKCVVPNITAAMGTFCMTLLTESNTPENTSALVGFLIALITRGSCEKCKI